MINLFEAAALDAIEHLLPPGYQSLGTRLDVRHIAATPVGMKVSVSVKVLKIEGRIVLFSLQAHDEKELIGDGQHERVVVNVEKFDQRVARKHAPGK
jgi:predicted thioesterase